MQLPHAVTAYNTLVLPMKFQTAYIHMPARPFRQHRAALVFLPNDTRRIQANMSIGINVEFFINQFPEIFVLLIKVQELLTNVSPLLTLSRSNAKFAIYRPFT